MPKQALSHLKVLELCNLVSGPYCTKLLADLGAEVIKIEPPGVGDEARRRGPFLGDIPHPERSGLFFFLNTNKLGVTLNIRTSTGRTILKKLIEQTDILVEDNSPAVMEDLGLTYQNLKQINGRLVMTSITPFGQTGPYRDHKAYELNSFHAGGEGYMMPIESDYPDREPLKGGGLAGDCICGLSACLATLAAAYRMTVTGLGQSVDVSKQDVLMTMVGLEVAMFTYSGVVRNRRRRAAITPVPLKCRDGYVQISAFYDRDWRALVRFMGNDGWAKDEGFSDVIKRWQRAAEINQGMEEWAQRHGKNELFHGLQDIAIAAVPVNTSEDLANCPQLEARGFFAEIEHPEMGKLRCPTASYKLSRTPCGAGGVAPLLGQHNESVYCGRLGYAKRDLVRMVEAGVL